MAHLQIDINMVANPITPSAPAEIAWISAGALLRKLSILPEFPSIAVLNRV